MLHQRNLKTMDVFKCLRFDIPTFIFQIYFNIIFYAKTDILGLKWHTCSYFYQIKLSKESNQQKF